MQDYSKSIVDGASIKASYVNVNKTHVIATAILRSLQILAKEGVAIEDVSDIGMVKATIENEEYFTIQFTLR